MLTRCSLLHHSLSFSKTYCSKQRHKTSYLRSKSSQSSYISSSGSWKADVPTPNSALACYAETHTSNFISFLLHIKHKSFYLAPYFLLDLQTFLWYEEGVNKDNINWKNWYNATCHLNRAASQQTTQLLLPTWQSEHIQISGVSQFSKHLFRKIKVIPKMNLLEGNARTYFLACFMCNHAKL
jgi:hypothetical protein